MPGVRKQHLLPFGERREFDGFAATLLPAGHIFGSAQIFLESDLFNSNVLVDKKYPPAQLGNPAAGLLNGSVQDARAYFRKCVDNKGKVDAPPAAK